MSQISIANNALMRIGVTRFIESLAEPTIEAQVIRRVYDVVRRAQLRRLEWSFAKQIKKLALTQYSQKPWQYVYRYPNDALRVMRLTDQPEYGYTTDSSEQQLLVGGQQWVNSSYLVDLEGPRIPYESLVINGQKVICTNLALASAVVIDDVTDTNLFDPLFEELLTWELAKEICTPLAVSSKFAEFAHGQAEIAFDKAMAATLDEQAPSAPEVPSFIKARQ